MSRLVIAVLILFAVLVGLRAANSSMFQRNVIDQSNSANQPSSAALATRNTGFNTESTGLNAGTARLDAPGRADGITPLPPRSQPAIQGDW